MSPPTGLRRRLARVATLLAALAAGALVAAWFVTGASAPEHTGPAEYATPATFIEVQPLPFRMQARGQGLVRPAEVWQAVANVPGRIVQRHPGLENGMLVSAGTLLLEIDPRRYQLAIAEAEAELASLTAEQAQLDAEADNVRRLLELERERLRLAEAELARNEDLAASGVVSQTTLDQQWRTTLQQRLAVQSLENQLALLPSRQQRHEAQVERAATRLARARQDLADTRFVAPFDLRVGAVDVERHQHVAAGQRLFQGDGIDAAEVVAHVPLSMLWRLMGALPRPQGEAPALDIAERLDLTAIEAEVVLEALAEARWSGRVVRVASGLDPGTRSTRVVVRVEQPYRRAEPGRQPALVRDMFVHVLLAAREAEPLLALPRSAVHQGVVYLVDAEDRLERREVTVAFEQQGMAVIAAGLSPGERLVVDDLIPAVAGMALAPQRDTALEQRLRARAAGERP